MKRAACLALVVSLAVPLAAQPPRHTEPSSADRAIAQGRFADAESALYDASRRAPRNPSARGALGAFLASRGRLKVGAVLLEEARQFGGDARAINERLQRVYAWSGEWSRVAALAGSGALSSPERTRAKWLASHPPMRSGPDSTEVPLEPNDMFGLGTLPLDVGGATLRAEVDPGVEGLVLPAVADFRELLELFGSRGDTTFAVARRVGIGALTLTGVPVRLEPDAHPRVASTCSRRSRPPSTSGRDASRSARRRRRRQRENRCRSCSGFPV